MQIVYIAVLAFFGLHLVILVHELGHYIVARKYGLAIPRLVVGFGPRLFGWIRGETSFEWRLFPVLGFVKLLGLLGPEEADIARIRALRDELSGYGLTDAVETRDRLLDPKRHFYSLNGWQQIAVLLAGPAMSALFGGAVGYGVVAWEVARPTLIEATASARNDSPSQPELIKQRDIIRYRFRARDSSWRMIPSEGCDVYIQPYAGDNNAGYILVD